MRVTEYVSQVSEFDSSSPTFGAASALMILAFALVGIAILYRIVAMMTFDRMVQEDSIDPEPEGFDPEVESRRDFHRRSLSGIFTALLVCATVVTALSLVIVFAGISR